MTSEKSSRFTISKFDINPLEPGQGRSWDGRGNKAEGKCGRKNRKGKGGQPERCRAVSGETIKATTTHTLALSLLAATAVCAVTAFSFAGLEKVVESEDDQEVGLESGQEPVVDADVGAGADSGIDSDVDSTPEPDLEQ